MIENAERLPETQVRFAERLLSGAVDTDGDHRWMVEGTTAFATAVEAIVKGWPIAEALPSSIRRQLHEHLGWEWDGDPGVPSGSESLRDAQWVGVSRGGSSPYSEVLTADFLEEAYVEAGFSGPEIAELVGSATGTVYSALRRHGILRRRTASSFQKVLTEAFLTAEYVEVGRSASSIAEEVGCDASTVYSALLRHGITCGSVGKPSWRDISQLMDLEYLRREHIEEGKSISTIAAELGWARGRVRNALEHHGLARSVGDQPASYSEMLSREFLIHAYVEQGLSGRKIAAQVGCHPTTVYEALRRHGIKATGQVGGRTQWEDVLTSHFLRRRYVLEGKSGGQIADEIGCSSSVVYAWLDRHGIERREAHETRTGSTGTDWDPDWLRQQYLENGRSGSEIADELEVPTPTLYGALRRFGIRRS